MTPGLSRTLGRAFSQAQKNRLRGRFLDPLRAGRNFESEEILPPAAPERNPPHALFFMTCNASMTGASTTASRSSQQVKIRLTAPPQLRVQLVDSSATP